MMDALLFAVRDAIRGMGAGPDDRGTPAGYDVKTCEIMDDGRPPPRMGVWFVAIHEGEPRQTKDNCIDEYYPVFLTVTRKVDVPLDRVGESIIARKAARQLGFNARCEVLKNFLHMNWEVVQEANNYLVQLADAAEEVYGFCEPLRYRGMTEPRLVGGEWFGSDGKDLGLVSDLSFVDARRFQPLGAFT